MRKLYVAASFLDKEIVKTTEAFLQKEGFEITSEWVNHPGTDDLTDLECEAEEDVADAILCDTMIVLMPGRLGTHVEIGIALGLGKTVVLVGEVDQTKCVYYNHPNVWVCGDIKVASNLLGNLDKWE